MSQNQVNISRVTRSKETAKASYDRMSAWYDLIAGSSEWPYAKQGLELLNPVDGETILELGYGTGKGVTYLANAVGENGFIYGVDLSAGMKQIADRRIIKEGLAQNVDLRIGDAAQLDFESSSVDAIFCSFTLELFDTPEIPLVLRECRRVLKNDGRIVIVSLAIRGKDNFAIRLYNVAHENLPAIFDCRPIYVVNALAEVGFEIKEVVEMKMWGLPVDAALALK